MTSTIEISIIIPLYNRANGIQRLLHNLSLQSFDMNRVEVIISDDKSTDNSLDVAKTFVNQLPNLIILESDVNSGGASVPRNKALDIAKGKWILFIDSDDYITEYSLADAIATANKSQDDMVCLPYFRAKNSNRPLSRSAFYSPSTISNLKFEDTKLYNSLNVIGKLIKRDIIEQHRIRFPENIRVREDNWFLMQVYSVVNSISILGYEKNYYFYEQQDEVALTNTKTPPRDAVKIYIAVYDFVKSRTQLSNEQKINYLTIFLNRYTNMIKRGKHAPVRFFNHTKPTLLKMLRNQYVDDNTIDFIEDLFLGKYDIAN